MKCQYKDENHLNKTKVLIAMKLTILLSLFFTVTLNATGFGQERLSLRVKKTAIADVLRTIEQQSGYRFLYNENIAGLQQKVSINTASATVDEILPVLLFRTDMTWQKLENKLIVIKEDPLAVKDVTVTGFVKDSSGAALSGVSVQVKNTDIGTVTDNEGAFTINVPDANSILVFSRVGYQNLERNLNGSTSLNIVLLASQEVLDQVVVVGYGTQRKRDLTGSIASVSGDEIARMPNTNPISSLQGKVAGLTISNSGSPGAAPTVRVRGINSTNSASPLYVVDGILQDNIDYLNPADIESIDVLRDPSSIAIYGLSGANGVIAVTTKKAARGQTRVNLNSSVGFSEVRRKIAVTDADGFKKLYSAQLSNLGATPFDFSNYEANTDWQDQILRKAMFTNHSLSLSNSGEKTTTYFNLGYNKQEGVVKYGSYERFVARLNEEIRITKSIKVGADVTGTYWNTNPTSVSLTNALWAAPIVPIQAGEDLYYSMPSFQRAQVGNPVATLNRNNNTSISRGYRFVGSAFAEFKILNQFTWKSTFYTDLGFNTSRDYAPLPYRFINLGEMGGATDTTFNDRQFTSVSQSQREYRKFQQDHTLTWDKNFGGGHRLTAMGGFTTVYTDNTGLSGNRRDTTLNIPNNPDFWYIDVANINNPGTYGGSGGKNSLAGAFARVSYAFKNRYLLNATVRRDGSSKFAPDNRWGTFGSVGAGWVISDENFFSAVGPVNFLKLRAAWGKIGNSNGVADNLYQPGVSNASTAIFGDNIYTSVQAAYIPDPNLHWEVVRGIDVGLDIRAFDDRFNAEINWYDRTTSDILTSLEIPNDSRRYFTNLGKITNRGIEVAAGWKESFESGFSYGINGNFSYNKNTVNSIGDNFNFQILGNEGANKTESGQSIGYFYGYQQMGIYQSPTQIANSPYYAGAAPGDIMYADIDGNDTINTADRAYLGTPFPPYSFAASFTVGYKGFDLLVEGQGVAGNKIYTERRTSNFATLNYEANRLNAWTGPATSNIEPILDATRGNNFLFSSHYLEPGNYFRLRTVQLGYTLKADRIKAIRQARIYISGQNIATWTKVTGYSPEAPISSILGGGADNGIYPVPATYTFGINFTF
ncbi:TonB-dependent receptor [Niabella insulamsoli]|uniref:SusC/RagA family TonB-linked outer membrane protein n=1 Tax=Niabella insulamsoli TaxID=3144874 RepID=UPI0031FC9D77